MLNMNLFKGVDHSDDQFEDVPESDDPCELSPSRVVDQREGSMVLHNLALDHLLQSKLMVQNHNFAIVRETVNNFVFFEEGADLLLQIRVLHRLGRL